MKSKILLGLGLIVVLIFSFYSWSRVEKSSILRTNDRIEKLEAENDSLKNCINYFEQKKLEGK